MKIADFEIDAIYDPETGIYRLRTSVGGSKKGFLRDPKKKFDGVQIKSLLQLLMFLDYLIIKGVHPKQLSSGVLKEMIKQYLQCSNRNAERYAMAVYHLCKMSRFF